jgi:DNA-damage-inducible protein J
MPLRRNTIVLQCGMAKESYINARVDKQLKTQAEKVLRSLGVSTSDLITMLLRQVVLTKGVPFDVRLPNEETIRAMAELEGGGGETSTGATREILDRATRKRG